MELYSPTREKAKPIKITVTKEELQQIAVGMYRRVDTHPIGRRMKEVK